MRRPVALRLRKAWPTISAANGRPRAPRLVTVFQRPAPGGIAVQLVYSLSGSLADCEQFCDLAKRFSVQQARGRSAASAINSPNAARRERLEGPGDPAETRRAPRQAEPFEITKMAPISTSRCLLMYLAAVGFPVWSCTIAGWRPRRAADSDQMVTGVVG